MKRLLVGGAVLALGIGGMGLSSAAPSTLKVTGGGQTLVPVTGPGDTVAFSAQTDGTTVKGQFQYKERSADAAAVHGVVTCVVSPMAGVAVIGGTLNDAAQTPFRVDVTDDGQGEKGSDLIIVRIGDSEIDNTGPNGGDDDNAVFCDNGDEPDSVPPLDRGNVTIHQR